MLCPVKRLASVVVEDEQIGPTNRAPIVVPHNARQRKFLYTLHTFVRIRPISDNIAEAQHSVERLRVHQHHLEGRKIAMNVRNH
jgi:hypothetical protein